MENRLPIISLLTIGLLPGFLKKFIYRTKGYKIGRKVNFSFGSVILVKNNCEINDYSSFGFFSMIRANNLTVGFNSKIRSMAIINANDVIIGNDVIISETAIIRTGHLSKRSNLTIKDRVHIFPKTIIDPSLPILLDEECAVGFYTNIFTHGSYKNILEGYRVQYGEVTIGKRVELTYNVFVAPGVTIGDDAIIAWGSYVNKDIPAGVLAGGTPAKVKRTKEEFAPVPSSAEKEKIVSSIITEFIEYLEYSGKFTLSERLDNYHLLKNKSVQFRIFLFTGSFANQVFAPNDLVLLLNTGNFSEELIKSSNGQIFDLSRLRCSVHLQKNGLELKKFLSRYGIRFSVDYH